MAAPNAYGLLSRQPTILFTGQDFLSFVTSAHHEIFLNFFSTKNSKMKLKRLSSLFLAHLHLSFIGMPSFKSQNILFYKKHLPMPCYFLGSCRTLLV